LTIIVQQVAGILERENELERIKDILRLNPKGLTIEEVSKKLSLNRATAAKYLNSLVMSGQADLRELGRAKLFYLSQRLPLTNLLSLSSDLILILDKDLFIQEANDSFLAFFKVSKEDLKGRQLEHSSLASYVTAEHFATLKQALDGSGSVFDIHIEGAEEDRYFRMKFIPLVFEEGERAVGIIFEDITEMKKYQVVLEKQVKQRTAELVVTNDALEKQIREQIRAQDALKDSEEKFRGIFDTVNDGIHLQEIGTDGMPEKFIDVNETACRMLQYSRDEMLKQEPLNFDSGDHNRPLPDITRELSTTGHTVFETRHHRKDGTLVPVEINVHIGHLQGKRVAISVVRDITERKQAEDAIKKANKQVSLLTSITRHDILNQLTMLEGYIARLKKLPGDDNFSGMIQKEEKIVKTIYSQIVFTRIYQNVGVQPPQWKNVKTSISSVLVTANVGNVSVVLNTGNLEIYADLLIEKVFFNLIENALRHGKHVTRIWVSYQQAGKNVILAIEDDGIGIPEQDKEQIFTRGYGKNTGYGLFLTREILAITGIIIRETGTPGTGARFEMIVPEGAYRFAVVQ
jgi:PAS domain S-box-containing protein